MSKRYCKLIMVTPDNNNKYYEMEHDGNSSTFHVKYGRVESTAQTGSYPISKWDSKYREKVNKGYKDVTAFVSNIVQDDGKANDVKIVTKDTKVQEFMLLMKKYTDNKVSTTYSVKCDNVTQAQVDEAQRIIDKLSKEKETAVASVNGLLVELYTVIPRKMGNVKDNILPNIDFSATLIAEQDNLDAMASQVKMYKKDPKAAGKTQDLLGMLGLTMKETTVNKEIKYLIDQCGGSGARVHAILEVDKKAENDVFDKWMAKQKNKQTRVLIHGTRCSSVIPILKTNLQIRPAGNFQFSGKVYGDGNYFSETVRKSLNYVGGDRDKVLLVYEVHTGNPFVYDGWYRGNSFTLNYKNLADRGFDSTFVKAGGGLLNTEIIAYKEEQNRIKYIIWLKD